MFSSICLSLVLGGVYKLCVLCRVAAAAASAIAYSMHCTPLQLRAFGLALKCENTHTIMNRTMWNNTRCIVCFVRSLLLTLDALSYRAET